MNEARHIPNDARITDWEKIRAMDKTSIILGIIKLMFLLLWVPVAVDKLWDLQEFHSALLRQPFPDCWADILFWLLPLVELTAAVLIAWRNNRRRNHQGMWLSAVLMFGFTIYILFGVLGWYEKRPCGCGSVISGLSWEDHLWFNVVFLLVSIIGIWFTRARTGRRRSYRKAVCLFFKQRAVGILRFYRLMVLRMRFTRKFAVFRRRAVHHKPKVQEACSRQLSPIQDPCAHAAGKLGMPLNFSDHDSFTENGEGSQGPILHPGLSGHIYWVFGI